MNPNARQWTDALRSGAYRQTTHRFREPARFFWRRPAFCAIGVLYDLYLKASGETWPTKPSPGQLPEPVLEWAGISRELEHEVVTRNDTGTSFRDIASIIEAHFHRADRDRRWEEAAGIASRAIEEARELARARCVGID
jgi:hypothetical protein